MRETLFRGKRIDNGEWVCGCLVHGVFFKAKDNSDIPYIFNIDDVDYDDFEDFAEGRGYYEVYPETVGMCVPGITDKNGKKIFEGDIVETLLSADTYIRGVVKYTDARYMIVFKDRYFLDMFAEAKYSILGNIHDNPELLEVEE